MTIGIITLNWNNWYATIRCLESVFQSKDINYFVIVVDNGSTDNSIEKIRDWANGKIKIESDYFNYNPHNKPIKIAEFTQQETIKTQKTINANLIIIKNKKNLGFAEGNNIGINFALQRNVQYCMLLNNDTVVDPACIKLLLCVAKTNNLIGACQSKMVSFDNPRILNAVGISIIDSTADAMQVGYNEEDIGQYNINKEIFGVCAGASLYRSEMLKQIGLFDKDFFAYYEDVDLALRAKLSGWKSMYVYESIVYHCHSLTLGNDSPIKACLLVRNKYFYIIKNMPLTHVCRFLKIQTKSICRNISLLIMGKVADRKTFLKGTFCALINVPMMLIKRKIIRSSRKISDIELKKWFK